MNEITTLVCFHDLLGFGNMVAVSGGTFNSAVGKVAHRRISLLRETVSEQTENFPKGSHLFQMNDSAIAVCDLDLDIGSMHVEADSIHLAPPNRATSQKALDFLWASAKMHHRTIQKESDEKIGPAGRTFVVLGKRWPITEREDAVDDLPELQANLAFAEAYMADSQGSKSGFDGRSWDRIYVNDYLWFLLNVMHIALPEVSRLSGTEVPPDLVPRAF